MHLTASQWQKIGRSLAHSYLRSSSTVSFCAENNSCFSVVKVLIAVRALDALRKMNCQLDGGSQLCLKGFLLSTTLAGTAEKAFLLPCLGTVAMAFLTIFPSRLWLCRWCRTSAAALRCPTCGPCLFRMEKTEFCFKKKGPRVLARQSLHDPQSGRHHLADLFPPAARLLYLASSAHQRYGTIGLARGRAGIFAEAYAR